MGAIFETNVIKDIRLKMDDKQISKKAEEIFEQEAHLHGHGGYSGTLAEKRGQGVRIHRQENFTDTKHGWRDANKIIEDNEKWDAAETVPIVGVGWLVGGWCSS